MKTSELFKILVSNIEKLSGKTNLFVDYSSVYGGYRLVQIVKGGGHSGIFGGSGCESRLPRKQFENKLRTIIGTLKDSIQ